jgi:hypothetical protein
MRYAWRIRERGGVVVTSALRREGPGSVPREHRKSVRAGSLHGYDNVPWQVRVWIDVLTTMGLPILYPSTSQDILA